MTMPKTEDAGLPTLHLAPSRVGKSRGAAILATAATYFHFLLFTEFAFLELVRSVLPGAGEIRIAMIALGAGGIAGAIAAALVFRPGRAPELLSWSLRGCALAALFALTVSSLASVVMTAAFAGTALGAATVVLASMLRAAVGNTRLGLCIGAGTGLAYAACNGPWVFHATPVQQTVLAALAAALASFLPHAFVPPVTSGALSGNPERGESVRWIAILLALVWLDSAAFYIVQHTDPLRSATWSDAGALTANAVVHFGAALVAGFWLDRRRRGWVVSGAVIALALAGLALGGQLPAVFSANALYTAGVSLYSVALVEFPARTGRPGIAALVFGVAGWAGSALGIGMAQDLARIPPVFIAVAVATVAVGLLWRRRRMTALVAIALAAIAPVRADEVALGREVYIAEGCIHCHSQYIRPRVASEVLNWGPAKPLGEALHDAPPLIGTRRQGPDLSHIGNRRSIEWNRLHLIDPPATSPGSRMPSYAHLFAADDRRGEALLAYLASLGAGTIGQRREQIAAWKPEATAAIPAPQAARLFSRLCAQCHGETGRGDGSLSARLSLPPPNWSLDRWRHVRPDEDVEIALSRIIKFGVIGLPMAGHEYLPDGEIVGLARHVRSLHGVAVGGVAAAAVQP